MPGSTTDRARQRQRTLAEKLQWLRELKTPRGEQPPSYDMTARLISERTETSISGPYFWELATGRSTNPKLHHLRALARFFNVPVAYLAADENADFEYLEAELELLHALKQRGVHDIRLHGATDVEADLATVQDLLGRLRQLDGPGGDQARETALRLAPLDPEQQQTLHDIIDDPPLLNALRSEPARTLTRAAADLDDTRTTTAATVLQQLPLLDALHTDTTLRIALGAATLSEHSRQAVLTLVEHLTRVENAAQV
ncbi:hypothetical protein RM780_22790 [Streptomyces sp. DSM 44917]|uniref:HTH cro/C1-type domain-containing protein n=1 Tax=Streptomyces boetiae TaxID=3075541 RepID=A0ABU2LE48_9ACTN|nr:hypothetical protein [Streptomyces sp. DSM 44917]MDT0309761.1 hypothetical protein [Streptomyces sp. DSM 44917]